jgi:predicted phosphodiesterase
MTTLVFSDTHFTRKFDQKRFKKLAALIKRADRIIIDGDFWEGLSIRFDDFMKSEWSRLFPLLKAKDTIYVFGNHDDPAVSDAKIYDFCNQAVADYKMETPARKYYFTHGQDFLFPKMKDPNSTKRRALKFLTKVDILIAEVVQTIIFKFIGPTAFPTKFNKMSFEERKRIAPLDYLLVCGHSHRPQYQPEINFIDIGFFNFGWANYMIIDDRGEFDFISEKYR